MKDLQKRLLKAVINSRKQRSLGWFLGRNDHYLISGALAILSQALGQPWVERNTLTGSSDFFGKPGDPTDVRLQSRICMLAEMVFNLAGVQGFDLLLMKLQAVEKRESYEVAFSELEAASMLMRLGVPFSIRTPSNTRGDSYDFDVLVAGQPLPCDAKCKVEGIALTENGIYNPIHRANDQFPDGSCYLLMMKLPVGWDRAQPPLPDLGAVTERAFRNHSRLLSVIYFWERTEFRDELYRWGTVTDGRVRPDAGDRIPGLGDVLARIVRPSAHQWDSIVNLLTVQTLVVPPL